MGWDFCTDTKFKRLSVNLERRRGFLAMSNHAVEGTSAAVISRCVSNDFRAAALAQNILLKEQCLN